MPEGPEVEAARTSVEKHCIGSSVLEVVAVEQGGGPRDGQEDEKVCMITDHEIKSAILNQTVQGVFRKGKHFWIAFSSGSSMLFHFGMTGSVAFQNRKVSAYKAFKVSSSWPPKFTKLMISFSNGEKLAFCDPRRMGRIRIIKDPLLSPPISTLAPDPLIDGISVDQFLIKLAKYTSPIKSILLDQEKLCCGIGNWVADEVLFQAGIHPETPCNVISACVSDVTRIVNTICSVLQQAVEANADDSAFPPDWLFHRRWGKGKVADNSNTMLNGDAITFITVGGRTSAVVLNRQKKPLKLTSSQNKVKKKNRQNAAPISTKVINKNKKQKTLKDVTETHPPIVLPTHVKRETVDKQNNYSAKKPNQRVKESSLDVPLTLVTRSMKRKATEGEKYRNT